jgi:hypothetical protein
MAAGTISLVAVLRDARKRAPQRLTLKSKKPETLEKAGDFGPVA